jgi:hypothetical protein
MSQNQREVTQPNNKHKTQALSIIFLSFVKVIRRENNKKFNREPLCTEFIYNSWRGEGKQPRKMM